jgi:hypothetical protein
MGLFGGVGSSGMSYASEAMYKDKDPSDKWQKGFEPGPPIGSVPRFFYSAFLSKEGITNEQLLERTLFNANSKLLEDILPFVQNKGLKKKIYENLRSRIFYNTSRSKSIIINEFSGLLSFARDSVLYGIATFKIHIGK